MTSMLVPLLAVAVVVYGLVKGVDVYEAFVEGAAEGLPVLYRILPYLAAMLIAVRCLDTGGLIDDFSRLIAPICAAVGLDASLVPLILLRPFSGSASMAMLVEIFETQGVDSVAGYTASVLMGSSETIFYEVALYFGAVGIKKTRYTIPIALAAMLAGVITCLLICAT